MKSVKSISYWKELIRFFRDKNADWKPKAGVALAVLYLIWPADLIMDLIPLFGWLDDIGVTALAVGYLAFVMKGYINNKE